MQVGTKEVKEEAYYRMEASYGTFERFIPLPEGSEDPKIEALHKEGVLEVIVPAAAKAPEPPKPRSIPVKTARPVTPAKKVAQGDRAGAHHRSFPKEATGVRSRGFPLVGLERKRRARGDNDLVAVEGQHDD